MKQLVLSNGTTLDFTDSSTIYDLVQVVETFAEIDSVREEITEQNLEGATFNEEPVSNVVPVNVWVEAGMTGNITVHFTNRDKTDIEIWQEQQDEAINAALGF